MPIFFTTLVSLDRNIILAKKIFLILSKNRCLSIICNINSLSRILPQGCLMKQFYQAILSMLKDVLTILSHVYRNRILYPTVECVCPFSQKPSILFHHQKTRINFLLVEQISRSPILSDLPSNISLTSIILLEIKIRMKFINLSN